MCGLTLEKWLSQLSRMSSLLERVEIGRQRSYLLCSSLCSVHEVILCLLFQSPRPEGIASVDFGLSRL